MTASSGREIGGDRPARLRHIKSVIRRFLPQTPQKHRILSGPLRGRVIWTSWRDYPAAILGTTESALIRWFLENVHDGETWIDVGAHYGYTSIALASRVGPRGRVFSFEPVLSTAACLEKTRDSNELRAITVVPVALVASGSLRSQRFGRERGMAEPQDGRRDECECLVCNFDEIWCGLSGANPQVHGVKIDVQGMETEVVLGMRNSLHRWRPRLIVEFHRGVDRQQFLEVIGQLGYMARGIPIDPAQEPDDGVLLDDRSYVFERLTRKEGQGNADRAL